MKYMLLFLYYIYIIYNFFHMEYIARRTARNILRVIPGKQRHNNERGKYYKTAGD